MPYYIHLNGLEEQVFILHLHFINTVIPQDVGYGEKKEADYKIVGSDKDSVGMFPMHECFHPTRDFPGMCYPCKMRKIRPDRSLCIAGYNS